MLIALALVPVAVYLTLVLSAWKASPWRRSRAGDPAEARNQARAAGIAIVLGLVVALPVEWAVRVAGTALGVDAKLQITGAWASILTTLFVFAPLQEAAKLGVVVPAPMRSFKGAWEGVLVGAGVAAGFACVEVAWFTRDAVASRRGSRFPRSAHRSSDHRPSLCRRHLGLCDRKGAVSRVSLRPHLGRGVDRRHAAARALRPFDLRARAGGAARLDSPFHRYRRRFLSGGARARSAGGAASHGRRSATADQHAPAVIENGARRFAPGRATGDAALDRARRDRHRRGHRGLGGRRGRARFAARRRFQRRR